MSETNMNPIFSLKNFRSFGEDGADFELAPITVLTGCNSAGKSSLVKSMLLLAKQSHQNLPKPIQVDRGYSVEEPIGGDLPVADKEFCLGNIHKVMNRHSGGGYIEFSYVIFSQILQDYVRVIKRFRPAETNFMIYGALSYVKIEKTDGNLLAEFSENSNIIAHLTKALHKIASPVKDILGDSYMNFCNEVLRKVSFLSNISYIDSPSAIIKRIYSVEDDDRLSKAIRKLYERGRAYTEYLNRGGSEQGCIMPTSFVNRWIKKYEIGDKIDIEMDDKEGWGAYVSLYKGNETSLLADEGYGISQLFTLLLQIDNNLPNIERHSYEPRWICVEEPEVHLHPKYQSLLADLFVEAYQKYNIHFIIETHSEYLIRRLRVMVADNNCNLKSSDVSLNYVDKNDNGISHNQPIKIQKDGSLDHKFGKGFMDESDRLAIELIKLKPILS